MSFRQRRVAFNKALNVLLRQKREILTKWLYSILRLFVCLIIGSECLNYSFDYYRPMLVYIQCVQKKTPTYIFFHISVNDVWI